MALDHKPKIATFNAEPTHIHPEIGSSNVRLDNTPLSPPRETVKHYAKYAVLDRKLTAFLDKHSHILYYSYVLIERLDVKSNPIVRYSPKGHKDDIAQVVLDIANNSQKREIKLRLERCGPGIMYKNVITLYLNRKYNIWAYGADPKHRKKMK